MSSKQSWGTVPLIELIDSNRPITYGILKPGPNIEDGVPYVRVVDLQGGEVQSSQIRRTTTEIAHQYRRSTLNVGDVLMSIRGHVGRCGVVPTSLVGANITQDTARLAVNEKCDSRFLLWCLRSPEIQRWMVKHTKGVAVTGINLGDVKQIPIPLPPLSEQKRIAGILDQADGLRRKRQQALALTDQFLRSTFLDLFGDPVTNPKRWPVVPLESACVQRAGIKAGPFGSSIKKEFYADSGYRVYGQEQVIAGSLQIGNYFIGEAKFQQLASCAVQTGDLLLSLVGSIGQTLVVPTEFEPGIINPRLLRIRPNRDRLSPVYLQHLLKHSSVQSRLQQHSHGGTMSVLNAGMLRPLQIPLPSLAVQRDFERVMTGHATYCERLNRCVGKSDALFNSLVQRVFRGEL